MIKTKHKNIHHNHEHCQQEKNKLKNDKSEHRDHENHNDHSHHHHGGNLNINKWFWIKHLSLTLIFLYFVVINILEPKGIIQYTWHYGIWIPITSYIIFWEGRKYFKIYFNIFKKIMDMNTLIGIASHVLYVYSFIMSIINWNMPMYSYQQMWEAPAILIIVTNIGHALENKMQKSSKKAYEKLNMFKNAKVSVIKNNKIIEQESNKLKIGDVVLVKKGEIVPVDGKINKNGNFDYSNITGESKIIMIKKNNEVISGAYNLGDPIELTITKNPSESTLSIIVDKITNLSNAKPKIQKLVDKILKLFVPVVILIAIITTIIWTIINATIGIQLPWIDGDSVSWMTSITAGVTVLAIACPCALGIATPLVYAVSSLLSAQNGIMINNPKSLEELSKSEIFCFDKTGTITNELFKISSIEGDKSLIGVAKALERNIHHPIAKTIISIPSKYEKVINIQHHNNKVTGNWRNKKVEIKSINNDNESTTNIALYINKKPLLIFKLENILKNGVIETIKILKANKIKTVMITGDKKDVAEAIAKKIDIDKVYYEITPNQKAKIINKMQKKYKVAFVGDGFNDAIAIKQANVSASFASGSNISNSISDISILKNDFYSIKNLFNISKMNNFSIKLSLSYAFIFNIIAIPVAIVMMVQPWLGATIMVVSDILVVANAFWYKKKFQKKLKKTNSLLMI